MYKIHINFAFEISLIFTILGSCGIQASSRVVNGVTAKKNNWPWMVHLKMSGLTGSSTCGGTLIHPQYVLTAAHCLTHFPSPSSMTLTLGDHDRSRFDFIFY